MLLFGNKDDRVIRTDPVGMTGQYNFITAEAIVARITKTVRSGLFPKMSPGCKEML